MGWFSDYAHAKSIDVDMTPANRRRPVGEDPILMIARVCHEANRAYCKGLGDESQGPWEDAPEWQRASAMVGVEMHLANPDASPRDSHDSWLEDKRRNGWSYGEVKDAEKKQHPCFMPYDELPLSQRLKDQLFKNIVDALRPMAATS